MANEAATDLVGTNQEVSERLHRRLVALLPGCYSWLWNAAGTAWVAPGEGLWRRELLVMCTGWQAFCGVLV